MQRIRKSTVLLPSSSSLNITATRSSRCCQSELFVSSAAAPPPAHEKERKINNQKNYTQTPAKMQVRLDLKTYNETFKQEQLLLSSSSSSSAAAYEKESKNIYLVKVHTKTCKRKMLNYTQIHKNGTILKNFLKLTKKESPRLNILLRREENNGGG